MAKGEVMRDGAHLVGSVPLDDAETVFRRVADVLGPCIARIPDGETGERTRWIYWQRTMLENHNYEPAQFRQ